jgi:hypothetical protein
MQSRFSKYIILFLTGVLCLVVGSLTMVFSQTWREYQGFKKRQIQETANLIDTRIEMQSKDAYLRKLIEDPVFLEHIVREKIGYTRPNEKVFYFEDQR